MSTDDKVDAAEQYIIWRESAGYVGTLFDGLDEWRRSLEEADAQRKIRDIFDVVSNPKIDPEERLRRIAELAAQQ